MRKRRKENLSQRGHPKSRWKRSRPRLLVGRRPSLWDTTASPTWSVDWPIRTRGASRVSATVDSAGTEAAARRETPDARPALSDAEAPTSASVGSSCATEGQTAATVRTNNAGTPSGARRSSARNRRSDATSATSACRGRRSATGSRTVRTARTRRAATIDEVGVGRRIDAPARVETSIFKFRDAQAATYAPCIVKPANAMYASTFTFCETCIMAPTHVETCL